MNSLMQHLEAQGQWRWINRAIDEVESGRVPGIILLCRNSTETEFFQRLRPYPKVFLLASNIFFRDYDNTPNGFGIALVCLARAEASELHSRFLATFAAYGEACIAVDAAIPQPMLTHLLTRAQQFARTNHRDHWLRCACCGTWRQCTLQDNERAQASSAAWQCSSLSPGVSCATPQTRAEAGSRPPSGAPRAACSPGPALPASTSAPPNAGTPALCVGSFGHLACPLAGATAQHAPTPEQLPNLPGCNEHDATPCKRLRLLPSLPSHTPASPTSPPGRHSIPPTDTHGTPTYSALTPLSPCFNETFIGDSTALQSESVLGLPPQAALPEHLLQELLDACAAAVQAGTATAGPSCLQEHTRARLLHASAAAAAAAICSHGASTLPFLSRLQPAAAAAPNLWQSPLAAAAPGHWQSPLAAAAGNVVGAGVDTVGTASCAMAAVPGLHTAVPASVRLPPGSVCNHSPEPAARSQLPVEHLQQCVTFGADRVMVTGLSNVGIALTGAPVPGAADSRVLLRRQIKPPRRYVDDPKIHPSAGAGPGSAGRSSGGSSVRPGSNAMLVCEPIAGNVQAHQLQLSDELLVQHVAGHQGIVLSVDLDQERKFIAGLLAAAGSCSSRRRCKTGAVGKKGIAVHTAAQKGAAGHAAIVQGPVGSGQGINLEEQRDAAAGKSTQSCVKTVRNAYKDALGGLGPLGGVDPSTLLAALMFARATRLNAHLD